MRTTAVTEAYEILVAPSGDRLWVNGADGSSIARFSKRFGIDVHNTATAQVSGKPECLFCTHGAASRVEWELFRTNLLEHHGIEIDESLLTF